MFFYLCFSLAFFGLPPFHFLFLCLSLVLFVLPSFLPFFVAFFRFLVLFFLFHEKNNIKCFYYKVLFINPFSIFWFPVLFLFENPFYCLCFFPDFKLCCLFNMNVEFQKDQLKHTCFWSRGGLQHNVF